MKMPKRPNKDSIIKNNPAVDKEQLKKTAKLLRELRNMGVKGSEYNIIPPFTRRTIRASDEGEDSAEKKTLR